MSELTDQSAIDTTITAMETAAKSGADELFAGALFPLGQLVITRGASDAIREFFGVGFGTLELLNLVRRHNTGDWGQIHEDDRGLNEAALENGERIFSVYKQLPETLWIITEYDRSYTTVLLPEES